MDQAVHRDGDWPSRGTLSGLVHAKNRKKKHITIYFAKHFLSRERVDTTKKAWRARNTKEAAKGNQEASKRPQKSELQVLHIQVSSAHDIG